MHWNQDFHLGVASIDAQHKELVNLLNLLQVAIQKGESQKAYANTLRALVEYTRLHFTDEEAYMQSIHYPALDEHRKIHESLVADIKNILISLKQNKPIQPISLMRFLNDWVTRHILDEDMKIGNYVKKLQRSTAIPVSSTDPFDNEGAGIIAKFQSLAKQREQKALTEEAYNSSCCDVLNEDFDFLNLAEIKGLEKAMSLLGYICKQEFITGDDRDKHSKVLVAKALASNILAAFADQESRMRFLKSLQSDLLLSNEDFENYKKEIE